MNRIIHPISCLLLMLLAPVTIVTGQSTQTDTQETQTKIRHFEVSSATSEIKIDGVLDEQAWNDAVVIDLPYEWFPGDNVKPPVRTDCMVTFDTRHLYIAFRAFDPEPQKIRAHIMDRDAINTFVQDDHLGIMIDPFNDERRAIQLRVNPFGVQMDAIFSETDGIEDWSWDLIWDSAGKINEEGYVAEISVPFNQMRFPRTSDPQTWGFEAFRSYPRSVRYRISSRYTDRNNSCILCQENKVTGFHSMSAGKNMEFDPTLTSTRTDSREDFPDGPLQSEGTDVEPGITGRWGFTSNLTLNGTVNPDFSQVEADVAQLNVNERFALFFEEKRPFFLEGVDFFATPLQSIFTRTVADPSWGAKVTGKEGKNGLGVFVTQDRINNLIFPSNQFSGFDTIEQDVYSGVFRYRRDIGEASTFGVLYSGREAADYHNRQYGFDGFLRLNQSNTIEYQYLRSDTEYPQSVAIDNGQPPGTFGGNAYYARYQHSSRNWFGIVEYEDLSPGFRADSGFIPRVDIRNGELLLQRAFWGSADSWYSRINVAGYYRRIEDYDGLLTDQVIQGYSNYSGPLQSFLEVAFSKNKEFFDGVTYDLNVPEFFFQIRPSGLLSFEIYGRMGDAIDFSNSRKSDQIILNPILELKLGRRINLQLNHTLQALDFEGNDVFTANLSQWKMLYHFNSRTYVRAILQYTQVDRNVDEFVSPVEPETRQLFSQFLFSYKVNARTVVFVGYSDNGLGTESIDLTKTDRTFFVKLGYAWTL